MKQFFECVVNHRNEKQKLVKKTILVEAEDFAISQANITSYMHYLDDIKEFDVLKMSKIVYDDIVFKNNNSEYTWCHAVVKIKNLEGKETTCKYLVADSSVKKATMQLTDYIITNLGDSARIFSIKEKPIFDIVLCKYDEGEGKDIVLSFEEHRTLELELNEVRDSRKKIMQEIGAYELLSSKYKIKVIPENEDLIIGKILGSTATINTAEDFVGEDSGDIVTIPRKEDLFGKGTIINKKEYDILIKLEVEYITLVR